MAGGLTTAREELAAALDAGTDFRAYSEPTGQFAAPCYRLHAGSPWLGPSQLYGGKRLQKWEIWVVVGRLDSKVAVGELESMVSAANAALDVLITAGNWGMPIWERPGPVDMGGTTYYAVRGTIETQREA
jgi:hypothetical protein